MVATNKQLSITIPRLYSGEIIPVTAYIHNQHWELDKEDDLLRKVLQSFILGSGHHVDRDLELARLAAKKLGGSVDDNRPEDDTLASERMPR